MMTIAPNRVPVHFVQELAAHNVLISLGHAEASYAEASAALNAGARAFTHLFNAMSQMSGREPGMVGAALDAEDSFVSIIADGHHIHPASLHIALAAKRHDRLMLITDAMPPAAGGPETFMLHGRKVVRADGSLRLEDGTLAGSALTMDEAVRYCTQTIGLGLANALAMSALVPAAFLRRDHELGRVAPGYLASLVHLSDDLYVRETWIEGRDALSGHGGE
jgi:N-acetylglucosamine-6-phosphate deacetylase